MLSPGRVVGGGLIRSVCPSGPLTISAVPGIQLNGTCTLTSREVEAGALAAAPRLGTVT